VSTSSARTASGDLAHPVMAAEFVKAGIDDLVEDVLEGNMLGVGLPDHA
jgi:hypothetical protein